MQMMIALAKIKVTGRVQGVGYRYYAYHHATTLGLKGYVRNMPDGSVESAVEGEKSVIAEYMKALKIGPSLSNVSRIDVDWREFEGKYNEFNIT
jgi:acylphosphatase